MHKDDLNRRDFHKLAAAAFGGLLAGAAAGCGDGDEPTVDAEPKAPADQTAETPPPAGTVELTEAEQLLLDEPHVCRGLNTCKGKGKGGDNACAGQGTCATVAAHACAGQNECKGQGGCGDSPGMNSCKGEGLCHVPLMESAWTTARSAFEKAMKKRAGSNVTAD